MITGKGPFIDDLFNNHGTWCWNSEVGCGPQIYSLKIVGITILAIFVFALSLNLASRVLDKRR